MPLHQTGVDLQKVYLLNETAQAVWELLAQARDLDALVAALAEEYEVDEEDLRKDVQELLDDLVQRGLVVQP
ncbi:MAG: PqqD family protein [Armatimonadia bacterium]